MRWLNYQHLLYFYAVAREGHLTRASEELGVTPQTVSAQIRKLEAAVGEPLFEREGRRLLLTDVGRTTYSYAEEIFDLGRELRETLAQHPSERTVRLRVGVADVVPKLIAHHLLEPALQHRRHVKLVCHEGSPERLLQMLAVHDLDVVLSDAPVPPGIDVRAYGHELGACGVAMLAAPALAKRFRKGFPASLADARMLLPMPGTALRRSMEQWFKQHNIRPEVAGEFDDSALMKVFGQAGAGVLPVPAVIETEVCKRYGMLRLGVAQGITERFYAISGERRVHHPVVAAICTEARGRFFAGGKPGKQ